MLKKVCAWCDKVLEEPKHKKKDIHYTSHGICPKCHENMKKYVDGVEIGDFLENFPKPILLVNSDGLVKNANKNARDELKVGGEEIQGLPPGKLIKCKNADLPGGCGKTTRCNGCTVRRIIEDSLNQGKEYVNERVTISHQVNGQIKDIEIRISSVNIEGLIYLKIDFGK